MDGLQQVAKALTLANDYGKVVMEQDARIRREQFEKLLGEFVDCKGVFESVGGVCNLLTTIGQLCEERSRLEGDDFEIAAQACDECAETCDLKYAVSE